jgi:cellulose biosynthesis protein BcsQ
MSEVISLINLKGGVGKTASSINIAYSFSEFNKKVLIVDADSQGNIATSLGMIADELDNTLCDLIDEAIDDGVTEQRVVECIRQVGKVDIIPANKETIIQHTHNSCSPLTDSWLRWTCWRKKRILHSALIATLPQGTETYVIFVACTIPYISS